MINSLQFSASMFSCAHNSFVFTFMWCLVVFNGRFNSSFWTWTRWFLGIAIAKRFDHFLLDGKSIELQTRRMLNKWNNMHFSRNHSRYFVCFDSHAHIHSSLQKKTTSFKLYIKKRLCFWLLSFGSIQKIQKSFQHDLWIVCWPTLKCNLK